MGLHRLVEAAQESPQLDVVLRHVPWGREVHDLSDGSVDVVFLHFAPGQDPDPLLRTARVSDVDRVAVFARGHRLAGAGRCRSPTSTTNPSSTPAATATSGSSTPAPRGRPRWWWDRPATTVEEMLAVVATGRAMAITSETVAAAHRSDDIASSRCTTCHRALHLVALAGDQRPVVADLLSSF